MRKILHQAATPGRADNSEDQPQARRDFLATHQQPGAADFPAEKIPPLPPEYERGFLTTSELQKTVLPYSRRAIFDLRRKGIIPSIQVGSKVLYHKESVIAALLRRQSGGAVQ
jgi:hypothetical protein